MTERETDRETEIQKDRHREIQRQTDRDWQGLASHPYDTNTLEAEARRLS